MPVTRKHYLSLSIGYLMALVDASQLWRALCAQPNLSWEALETQADLGTNTTAAAFIKQGPVPDTLESPPECQVRYWDDTAAEKFDASRLAVSGSMLLTFEVHVPTAYAMPSGMADANVWWTNCVGRILSEMEDAVASPGGYLNWQRIQFGPIGLSASDNHNDGRWRAVASFMVGHQGDLL